MHKIFDGIELVAFDIMGVIITEPSMVRNGLHPMYKNKFTYEYIKGLYNKAKVDVRGDKALWEGLKEENIEDARKKLLESFQKDINFEEIRKRIDMKGLRKGIISNMPENFGDFFVKKFELKKDFDPILISADIGVAKPDYGKYDEFLNRAKIRGDKVLFIDDKLRNLEMAKRFGFKTVQFDRGRNQKGPEPDLVIKDFMELV
jgi:HAD superfamily hydrolase (TIGR01549 family)